MCCPEPSSPQDAIVAQQYTDQKDLFDKTAKEWTLKYANPEAMEKLKIGQLLEMGFEEDIARAALEKHNWDEQAAIHSLIN